VSAANIRCRSDVESDYREVGDRSDSVKTWIYFLILLLAAPLWWTNPKWQVTYITQLNTKDFICMNPSTK